ncbi:MobF family relaxase [Saccharothrix longispora]|uniref:MobF family relaxase n=1 Tax=Saccharothrix longispora TaxID=33920 RepID=UPI0028FDB0E4|nr:MobF family relaxase [Saccharothrix longispora]MDU0294281.1 MobF family relaxase [Saccharothrix longispora]
MAYVKPLGFTPAEIDYRLGERDSCSGSDRERPLSTHPRGAPRGLLWIGQGLREVGITPLSPLTRDQFPWARALATGRHPHTGEVLVEPKKAVPEDAKLPISPLVRAVHGIAAQAGVPVSDVLTDRRLRDMFATAERVWRADGETARLRADHAGRLLDALGLVPDEVWQPGAFQRATANLFTVVQSTVRTGRPRFKRVPRRVVAGNAAYDLTVDIPKGDSVFLAIATPELAAQAEPMYLEQVLRTVDWLEARTAYGMRGKHGQGKTAATVPGSGFLGWAMIERTARPTEGMPVGDPHWHVHLTLANMTRGVEDGKWSTIAAGGRDLIRHAPVVQHMVHALIRHQMTTRFGVRYRRSERTGCWEIAGIADDTLRHFSKRNTDIRTLLTQLGHDPDTATRVQQDLAARLTRRPKTARGQGHGDTSDATLQDIWQGQELAAGRDPAEQLRHVLAGGHLPEDGEQPEPEPVVTAETIARHLLDPTAGLTSHSRRFTRADALRHVADAMPGGYESPEAIEAMTDRVLAHLDFVRLPQGAELVHGVGAKRSLAAQHMANAQQFTTTDVIDAEKIILRAAKASHPDQSPVRVTDPDLIRMALDIVEAGQDYPLSDEQRAAVTRLATDGRMVDTVNGAPGTGKTTLLRALRTVLEAAGYVVRGAASAAVAARNLQAESGIPSKTLTSLLSTVEDPDSTVLTGVDVLVVDEANLTDDRDRARLYHRAARTGTRIVEVGDKLQLRGVGAGSLFGHVHRLVDGSELVDNRRQRDEDEREAIALWRDGRYSEALAIWMLGNRLVATDTTSEATAAMLATWARMRTGAPDPHTEIRGLVMLSATRDMVDRLNHGAQALRLADTELGSGRTYALRHGGEIRFHIGDHVLMRINAVQRRTLADTDVLNGYRAVVTHIADDGTLTVEWQEDAADGRTTRLGRLTPEYIARGGVSLGYAMTVHKSEGLTVGDQWRAPAGEWSGGTVLFHAAGADNPAAHVATSRHRSAVHLFAPLDALDTEREATARPAPQTRAERMEHAVEKLARRARSTETSPDDLPVVVQLGLIEFRSLADAQTREQHARDADAAEREAVRRREERAEHSAEATQARAERAQQDQRSRDRMATLLREVWRHESDLVERIIAAAAFTTVARRLAEVENSGLDVREVLAQVPLRTVTSDAVTDPAAFTAWAVRDAAERLADDHVDTRREQDDRRQQWQLLRDQVADLVRETWTARPELAETVITSSTFDAVVRQLDRHAVAGLDARTLLARVPLAKVGHDNVEDPARLTAYFIKRTAGAHQWEADKAQRGSDRAAAERHRRRTALEHLRRAWPDHPEVVDLVAGGPAFGALAQRIEQAAEAGVDVHAALRQVSPTEVSGRRVKNPSALATAAFQRAAQQQTEPAETTAGASARQPDARQPGARRARHWAEREHGRHDDEYLRRLITEGQQRLATLGRTLDEARRQADELRIQVDAQAGPAVRALDEQLHRLREQVDLIRQADDLEKRWHAALKQAENAAADHTRAQHALDALRPLARTRRTELSEQVQQHVEREEQAHAHARDLATQAARLHERTGPPEQRHHTLVRANAAEKDHEHARPRAHQRDLDTLTTTQHRAERLAAEHHNLGQRIDGLRTEVELRADQSEEVRERERQERHNELVPAHKRAPDPAIERRLHLNDLEPTHPGSEIEPQPGDR